MRSLFFYLIITLVLIAVAWLFFYKRRKNKNYIARKYTSVVNFNPPEFAQAEEVGTTENLQSVEDFQSSLASKKDTKISNYDPNLIVLQVGAFPGKPYMGYELHQALLAAGLRFGERNIFHYYENENSNKVLFSLAAATANGSFAIEDMGSFQCNGLLLFMYLNPKQKLMASFDLMLDIARQLAEELGGEIYDDLYQPINADVIKRLREKICTVETNNLYVSDLLDNLD